MHNVSKFIKNFLRFAKALTYLLKKDNSASIYYTIKFNFHFLPCHQAVLLPIWLYNPRILEWGGVIKISARAYPGMIKLGKSCIAMFPDNKITLAFKKGSKTTFHGSCFIGCFSTIRVIGMLEFGEDFCATYRLSLLSMDSIKFGKNNTLAWEILIMDCSQHMLKNNKTGQKIGKYTKRIEFGENIWVCSRCTILPGSKLANKCILASNTIINKDMSLIGEACVFAGNPITLVKTGVFMDNHDCLPS